MLASILYFQHMELASVNWTLMMVTAKLFICTNLLLCLFLNSGKTLNLLVWVEQFLKMRICLPSLLHLLPTQDTLTLVMGNFCKMPAMIPNLLMKVYLHGRSLIKLTWPGRQDTQFIIQTYKLFGTNGNDHIDHNMKKI